LNDNTTTLLGNLYNKAFLKVELSVGAMRRVKINKVVYILSDDTTHYDEGKDTTRYFEKY